MTRKLIRVFEDNNFNNVIIPLSLDIDELTYIFHNGIDSNDKNICKKIINKYKNININFIGVSEDTIDNLLNEECIVDVSTSKYISFVLFDKALNKNISTIYLDEQEKKIKEYKTHSVICESLFKLNIEDMINLGGGKITTHMHDPIKDDKTKQLIYEVINNDEDYSDFTSYVALISSYTTFTNGDLAFNLNKEQIKKVINNKSYDKFISLGLFKLDNNRLTFPSEEIKRIFKSSGALLENYIFFKLKDSNMFDDVMVSVNIDFDSKHRYLPVNCEIDELVLKDNTLLFVSVKSNKLVTDDLNEIFVHNKVLGNMYSKPVICINSDLNIKHGQTYSKAEELGISIIDVPDIRNDNLINRFLDIINNKYEYEEVSY